MSSNNGSRSSSNESVASSTGNTSIAPIAPGEFPVDKYIKIAMKPRNGTNEPHFLLVWEGETEECWNPCRFTAHSNPSNRIGILSMIRRSFEENSELEYEPQIVDWFEESAIDWKELRRQGRAGWDSKTINPRKVNARQGEVEQLLERDSENEKDSDVDETEEEQGRPQQRRVADLKKAQKDIAHLQLHKYMNKQVKIPDDVQSPVRRYGKGSEHRSPLPSGCNNLPPSPFALRDHLPPLIHPIRTTDPGVIAQEVVRARAARHVARTAARAAAEQKAIEEITKKAKDPEDN